MTAAEKMRLITGMLNQGISPGTIACYTAGITRDDVLAVLGEIDRQEIVDIASQHVATKTTEDVTRGRLL